MLMSIQKKALTALATAIAIPATASQILAIEVVKVTENGKNYIYVKDATPNVSVIMETQGLTAPKAILANTCGLVKLTATQAQGLGASVPVNGAAVDISAANTLGSASCNGATPPQTTPFKDYSQNLYLPGFTPNVAVTVTLPTAGNRSAKANGCGTARFSEPTNTTWSGSTNFIISGTSYNYGTLSNPTYPPYCKNTGTSAAPNYVKYEPVN